MKRFLLFLSISILLPFISKGQATIDTAVDFNVKAIDGTTINLFHLLDDENKIVVIDFFSVTCGPCQEYAPDFQQSYLDFGQNSGNVFHMGINWGATIEQVQTFDENFGITYPTVSGVQGGGNDVYTAYGILSYPTVIIIDPETHLLVRKKIYPPTVDSLNNAIVKAGGILVGTKELQSETVSSHKIFPNPAKAKVNIDIDLQKKSGVDILLYDLTGRVVYTKSFNERSGFVHFSLNLDDVKSGIYFVKLTYNNKSFVDKLIINN